MGSETAMQVSQILIKSTESKSTIWSMIGVIILLVGSTAVCGVTKSLNLIWHVEVLPQRNIHYPESTTFSFGLILAIAFYF
jgi:membrane protein